jgi:hypothetical protein
MTEEATPSPSPQSVAEPSPSPARPAGAHGAHRRRGVTISLAGTDAPIFLLDGGAVVVRVTPTTTAGGAAVAVRDKVSGSRGDKGPGGQLRRDRARAV